MSSHQSDEYPSSVAAPSHSTTNSMAFQPSGEYHNSVRINPDHLVDGFGAPLSNSRLSLEEHVNKYGPNLLSEGTNPSLTNEMASESSVGHTSSQSCTQNDQYYANSLTSGSTSELREDRTNSEEGFYHSQPMGGEYKLSNSSPTGKLLNIHAPLINPDNRWNR